MTSIAVLGNTGMLGGMVESVLKRQVDVKVCGYGRKEFPVYPAPLNDTGARLSKLLEDDVDWIINCLGATKPYFNKPGDLSEPLFVNGLFPHQLAAWAELTNCAKVIHITTDCVFNGAIGSYDEYDYHSPSDLYGKSKSIGEPTNCMVLRTSIIGPEFGGNKKHFLSWVKSQDGKQVNGFKNHYWNGLTTLELSYAITEIIFGGLYHEGIFHLFSNDVSKYEMVKTVVDTYGLNIDITPVDAESTIDRRLRTVEGLNTVINPHSFDEMIAELKEWEDNE